MNRRMVRAWLADQSGKEPPSTFGQPGLGQAVGTTFSAFVSAARRKVLVRILIVAAIGLIAFTAGMGFVRGHPLGENLVAGTSAFNRRDPGRSTGFCSRSSAAWAPIDW
jgi:hypothetical protein